MAEPKPPVFASCDHRKRTCVVCGIRGGLPIEWFADDEAQRNESEVANG